MNCRDMAGALFAATKPVDPVPPCACNVALVEFGSTNPCTPKLEPGRTAVQFPTTHTPASLAVFADVSGRPPICTLPVGLPAHAEAATQNRAVTCRPITS